MAKKTMRISAIGSEMSLKHRSSEAGFTLVEILTALTIMGLMTSVVVLSLPSSDAQFRDEVHQLAARLEMAAQESVIDGQSVGFAIGSDGYAFQRQRNGAWIEFADDRRFSPHQWSKATFVTLERDSFFQRDGRREDRGGGASNAALPLVLFDPTGLPAHFTIQLERGPARYLLQSSGRSVEVSDASG